MRPESAPEPTQNPPQTTSEALAPKPAPTKKRAQWVPPRGIRYVYRSDRPAKPFQLVWSEDGKEKKQAFTDEAGRELVARALAEKRAKHGSSILTFDPARWRIFEQFTEIVGADTDPLQVAREWKAARGAGSGADAGAGLKLTVAEAVEKYLALREAEGGIEKGYMSHITLHLRKSLAGHLGTVRLYELTPDMLRDWLANLTGKDRRGNGGKLGIEARQHYYRSAHAFLARAESEEWVTRNICDKVAKPAPTTAERAASDVVKLMPVGDVEKLFRANRNCRVVGRLALEAFGGVRFTTASKMTADLINYEQKGLEMPGVIHKSRKRKFRQGQPAALWAWLEHVRANLPKCWEMTAKEYYNEKRDAFVRAGVTLPHNGLRHSFASYGVALTKDLPAVGYLMQHSKTTMTENYEGRATEADAKRYFEILP